MSWGWEGLGELKEPREGHVVIRAQGSQGGGQGAKVGAREQGVAGTGSCEL